MTAVVSVIVPCRNEAAFIGRCIDSILGSDYPAQYLEVIVADGMSTDGTRGILATRAAADDRFRVVDNPRQVTPVALNLAIGASRGDIVIRFDAHAVMPPDYVRRCVALLESSGADNVGGAIRTLAQKEGLFSAPIIAVLSSPFGVGNSSFRTGAGAQGPRSADTVFGGCWRRELFERCGGFNERLIRSQDIEFNLRLRRAGKTILLDPEIVSDYYARSSLAAFWRHNFQNGVWAVLPFAFSDIVPVRPRHLIPLAFVGGLAVSTVLPFPFSMAVPASYAAVNLAASVGIAWSSRKWTHLALLPVTFASLHVAYGLGSAWGCVRYAALKLRQLAGALPRRVRTETRLLPRRNQKSHDTNSESFDSVL